MGRLGIPVASTTSAKRRGVALLWLIVALPALLLFLVIVVEIGNLWLARLELEQSLEANALATAQHWAETNGRDGTQAARALGNDFSSANFVRGTPVNLMNANLNPAFDGTLNYDENAINGNRIRTDVNASGYHAGGVLVLGGVQLPDEDLGTDALVFNADEAPNRLVGANLLLDISEGGMAADRNGWGISFRASSVPEINDKLLVSRVVIDVDPEGSAQAEFANRVGPVPVAALSDGSVPKVEASGQSQPDHFGWSSAVPTAQVQFSSPSPSRLQIDFLPDGADSGFAPGDRFRFDTTVLAPGTSNELSADQLGQMGAKIWIYCTLDGEPWPEPLVGRLIDTDESGCATTAVWQVDELGFDHLVVHPSGEFDLPCPAGGFGANNGQAYVFVNSPEDPREYGVRAQASISVPSVCKSLGGIPLGPFRVTAGATAFYDPRQEEPKLVRPDQFLYTP